MGKGLQNLCKMYGALTIQGVVWHWDYAQNKARPASEFTQAEKAASEKAKWTLLAPSMRKEVNNDTNC